MRSLLVLGCFGSVLLGGCAMVSGLDQLNALGDGGALDVQAQDSPNGKDAGTDGSVPPDGGTPDGGTSDGGTDAKDASSIKDVAADAPCATTCPSGTTCNSGTFCAIPQGPTCGSGASFNGSSGDLDGTVCSASAGPKVQTTCASPINSPASFINFSSGGDPWNVTITAGNAPIQVQVMNGSCSTAAACTALGAGASTTVTVGPSSVVAIVSVSGCSDWQATYVSK
jgi:hypothetical protein